MLEWPFCISILIHLLFDYLINCLECCVKRLEQDWILGAIQILIIIIIIIIIVIIIIIIVSKIEAQSHETPEEVEVQRLVYATRKEKDDGLRKELEEMKAMLPDKTQRAVDLACEKGLLFLSKIWILISTSGNFVML